MELDIQTHLSWARKESLAAQKRHIYFVLDFTYMYNGAGEWLIGVPLGSCCWASDNRLVLVGNLLLRGGDA